MRFAPGLYGHVRQALRAGQRKNSPDSRATCRGMLPEPEPLLALAVGVRSTVMPRLQIVWSHCGSGYGLWMSIPGHLKIELEEERIRALTAALSRS